MPYGRFRLMRLWRWFAWEVQNSVHFVLHPSCLSIQSPSILKDGFHHRFFFKCCHSVPAESWITLCSLTQHPYLQVATESISCFNTQHHWILASLIHLQFSLLLSSLHHWLGLDSTQPSHGYSERCLKTTIGVVSCSGHAVFDLLQLSLSLISDVFPSFKA